MTSAISGLRLASTWGPGACSDSSDTALESTTVAERGSPVISPSRRRRFRVRVPPGWLRATIVSIELFLFPEFKCIGAPMFIEEAGRR
jgi:hypothetical protein